MSYFPVRSLTMVDTGTRVDFSSTNILDSGYTDIKTLTVAIKKLNIVHNGGGELIVRVDTTDIGYFAPGFNGTIDLVAAVGAVVRLKSVSGTISSGKLFINYLG